MRIREKRRQANLAARFFLLMLGVAGVLAGACWAFLYFGDAAAGRLGPGDTNLSPAERTVLLAYLTTRARDLNAPAGPDATPVNFSVAPGSTAGTVAAQLAALGLIRDAQLLAYYLRYEGLDAQVEAGDFILRQTMSIPQVAQALTDARAREVSLRVIEGWRREQIAEALDSHPALANIADEFLMLTGPNNPRPASYSFLSELAPGASLEGYVFPDTYLVRPDASASQVLDKMLANFQAQLPADYRTQIAARGLSLHQAITLAALIEREAAVDDERPVIASVILNRLAAGQQLQIDATVQYVLGSPGNWWPQLEGLDLRSIASPFNTYTNPGLPPSPIANPSLASILAVASPAQTSYFYYRALCDGSGRHAFAVTYDEHLANAC